MAWIIGVAAIIILFLAAMFVVVGNSGQRDRKLPDRLNRFVGSALFPTAMFVGYGYG